jgi:cellulose biosynthesis protein BcsS
MSHHKRRTGHGWLPAISIMVLLSAAVPSPSFGNGEFLGGWETDSHSNGYVFTGVGYIHPLTPASALATRVSVGYLYYRFPENGGETKVTSPGATLLLGPRFSGQGVSLTLTAGAEASTIIRETATPAGPVRTTENKVSAVLNGSLWKQLGTYWDLLYLANYEAANKYTWTRGTVKYRVTRQEKTASVFVGPEVTVQGNSDITSFQGGGMVEVYHAPSSFSLNARAGYKRSTFHEGPSQTGPYGGIGFYKQF